MFRSTHLVRYAVAALVALALGVGAAPAAHADWPFPTRIFVNGIDVTNLGGGEAAGYVIYTCNPHVVISGSGFSGTTLPLFVRPDEGGGYGGFFNQTVNLTNGQFTLDDTVSLEPPQRFLTDYFVQAGTLNTFPNFAFAMVQFRCPTIWVVSLAETGLPATIAPQATFDGQSVALPFHTTVFDGSTHTYSYPAVVPDPADPGTRYVTADAGGTVTVSQDFADTATYTTQHLLTVSASGLGGTSTHISNGATVLGTASDSSALTTWLDDGTALSLSADALVGDPSGTQYFFQGFTPAPPATLSAPVATTATYATLAQIVASALASGGIGGPGAGGLATSYTQQFAAVQADLAAGNAAQALLDGQSFISHVQAQAGKKVAPPLATTLQRDALLVYHQALCTAQAAGQIDAATASADYSYYGGLVSSLGGTPLPAC